MQGRGVELAVAALSGVLLILGAFATRLEAPALLSYDLNPKQAFDAVVGGAVSPALSLFSRKSALQQCLAALTASYGLAQPTPRRDAMLEACAHLAGGIAADNPSDAFAWTIGAMVAGERGDRGAFNLGLRRSTAVAPYEDWLAQLRFTVAEDHRDLIDHDASTAEAADMVLLAQSSDGAAVIARRYVSDADFRTRAVPILEGLPAADQRRLLDAIARQPVPPA